MMKALIRLIETQLQHFVEENDDRLPPAANAESKLVARLVAALHAGACQEGEENVIAPHRYVFRAHPEIAEGLHANLMLRVHLADVLGRACQAAGVKFTKPPAFEVEAAPELPKDNYRIHPVGVDPSATPDDDSSPATVPMQAFLIVDGAEVYPITQEVVNVGRKRDNDLVVDNPRVSRRHAQLRASGAKVMLFDLDSAGGTFVNGQRVRQAVLEPGDVISLAGVPLVYGEDAVRPTQPSQPYHPPEPPESEEATQAVKKSGK